MVFGTLGYTLLLLGLFPFARYGILVLLGEPGRGHLQSLIIGTILLIVAFLCLVLNIIADLIRINRVLTEDNLEHTKRLRFSK